MKKKKAGARERADQFLNKIGTAGGALGAPGLVAFGAGDTANQVMAGNVDEYAMQRSAPGALGIGAQDQQPPAMPMDLDASYLKLNLPGSPLPANGLLTPQMLSNAEMVQNQIMAENQMLLMQQTPYQGQLPMGYPETPKKRGR
jgi:hypothetical protein